MNLLDEYKELYYSSLEHSDRLNSKVGNSITFLTVIGTGNILVWSTYFTAPINTIFLILCFLSTISFLWSGFLFIKAYSGYGYLYFPADKINLKIKETKEIIEKDASDSIKEELKTKEYKDKRFNNHVSKMFETVYIRCVIHNFEQNKIKNNRQKKLTNWMVVSIILLGVAYAYKIAIMENIHI